jgi:mRNA interferase MazF
MPTTTRFEFGDIVLVPFPFSDQTTSKRRPAVVISSAAYHAAYMDLIVMAVTSQARPRARVGEAAIKRWRDAARER